MPEIKFPSEWLKMGINIEHQDSIRFLDAGELDPDTERWIFKVQVIHHGLDTEIKKFNLNKTNFQAIKDAYGSNSDDWVGKEMYVTSIKVRNPQTGGLVDSIALSKPRE